MTMENNQNSRPRRRGISLRTVLYLALIVAVYIAAKKIDFSLPSFSKLAEHTIVPTNTILRKANKIARLTTARYNDDFVYVYREYESTRFYDENDSLLLMDDVKKLLDLDDYDFDENVISDTELRYGHHLPQIWTYSINDSTENVICYIFTGTTVRAGYDLAKIRPDGIAVSGDTICVNLPEVEIFDVIINPKNYTVFDRVGSCWTAEVERQIFDEVNDDLRWKAIDAGIYESAERSGNKVLTSLFSSFGYKEVVLVPYEDWYADDDDVDQEQPIESVQLKVASD